VTPPLVYGGSKPLVDFRTGDIVLGAATDGWVCLTVQEVRHIRHPVTQAVTHVVLETDVAPVQGHPDSPTMYGLPVQVLDKEGG